jgi:hypothetical protein
MRRQSYKAQLHSPARKRDSTRRSDYARDRRRRYCASSSDVALRMGTSGFSPSRRAGCFRKWLKATCHVLGVGSIGFTPHSLRHGGATADFLRGLAVADIQFRGRWKCFESLFRYLQQAESLSIQQRLPTALTDLAPLLGVSLGPEALPPASFAVFLLEACPTAVVRLTPAPRLGRPPGLPPLAPGSRARGRSARAGPRVSLSREALR